MHKFPVFRTIASQFLVLVTTAVLAFIVLNRTNATSVLAGAMVSFVPNTLFTLKFFGVSGARSMERMVRNALIAEAVKLVLIGVGFALVFRFGEMMKPVHVFVGFAMVHLVSLAVTAKAVTRRLSI